METTPTSSHSSSGQPDLISQRPTNGVALVQDVNDEWVPIDVLYDRQSPHNFASQSFLHEKLGLVLDASGAFLRDRPAPDDTPDFLGWIYLLVREPVSGNAWVAVVQSHPHGMVMNKTLDVWDGNPGLSDGSSSADEEQVSTPVYPVGGFCPTKKSQTQKQKNAANLEEHRKQQAEIEARKKAALKKESNPDNDNDGQPESSAAANNPSSTG